MNQSKSWLLSMLQLIKSKTYPDNIFFINAESLQDKIDLGDLWSPFIRSDKPAQPLYKEEFLTNPNRGSEFYSKVFGQYGYDSISELVPQSFAVCLENISILRSTYLLHYRTLSSIEISTRYVKAFDYYKPAKLKTPKFYYNTCKARIAEYSQENDKTLSRICATVAQNELEKPAMMRAIKARALDETRDFLPLSAVTSLGIMANLRSWFNILTKEKVRNEPFLYIDNLINPLTELFKQHFPTIFSQDKIHNLAKSESGSIESKLNLETSFNEATGNPNDLGDFALMSSIDEDTKLSYLSYA